VYGVDILLGLQRLILCETKFIFAPSLAYRWKGKTKPVDVFTFVGARDEKLDSEFLNGSKPTKRD